MSPSFPTFWRKPAFGLLGLFGAAALGGCAQAPVGHQQARHSKEYFPSSIYGPASARVVAEGEDVPKGGGQYLVGHPYTVAGKTYVPSERKFAAVGLASWYGDAFHGRRTANGEIYDKYAVSAAHPTMPLPSYARVTNLRNNHSIIVRVNDRGPYHGGRVMDLSAKAAEALEYKHIGTAKVKVEYVGRAAISGSDDRKLLATLRVDGQPAQLDDFAFSSTRIAEQRDLPRSAPPSRVDRATELAALEQPESVGHARGDQRGEQQAAPMPPSRPGERPESEAASERQALAEMSEAAAPLPKNPPLPPQRPFDLGTIPGADAQIAIARR
ncbi:septal ring lytic transglycosylase RlpA family protein [uncultured Rhodoblastus sp.]|uniref:septal ring lytic transglycosylase RlpA family protein n=1 Tax=uncultured Rhodoblastus sp. TaxID=543037 RepID=UPI0025EAE203|nr:septal ring lytic transglycosylase RlpA family protein [uncultured Rhodoblastus sp.]